MAEITASMVKELREKTSAGMMDCKKALNECAGDMDAAVDWLRKKGLSAAAKKSGRVAAEGLVAVATEGAKGAIVELNAETDFVARNDQFQAFLKDITALALEHGDLESLKAADLNGKSVADTLTDLIATIGENMSLRRVETLTVETGAVASYVHGAIVPGCGKIAVLVGVESSADAEGLSQLGKQVAMHVAAARPEALDIASVDTAAVDREREVIADQARASGKPEEIIEKMVDGRLRKYYEQVVLLEQTYVVDGETKVSKVIENAAKDLGADVALKGYIRYELGEGIEKKEDNFADEVAAMAG